MKHHEEVIVAADAARRQEDRGAVDAVDAIVNLILIEARRRGRTNVRKTIADVAQDVFKRVSKIVYNIKEKKND